MAYTYWFLFVLQSCIPFPTTNNITERRLGYVSAKWTSNLSLERFCRHISASAIFWDSGKHLLKKTTVCINIQIYAWEVAWQPDEYFVPNNWHRNLNIKHSTPTKEKSLKQKTELAKIRWRMRLPFRAFQWKCLFKMQISMSRMKPSEAKW